MFVSLKIRTIDFEVSKFQGFKDEKSAVTPELFATLKP